PRAKAGKSARRNRGAARTAEAVNSRGPCSGKPRFTIYSDRRLLISKRTQPFSGNVMLRLLLDNPMLLLFVVGAIGYPLGHVKILGSKLGVAAVLFVGLAAGALHPEMKLPELVYQLGLVL